MKSFIASLLLVSGIASAQIVAPDSPFDSQPKYDVQITKDTVVGAVIVHKKDDLLLLLTNLKEYSCKGDWNVVAVITRKHANDDPTVVGGNLFNEPVGCWKNNTTNVEFKSAALNDTYPLISSNKLNSEDIPTDTAIMK